FSYFYFSNGSSKFLDGFFKGVSPVVIALLFYSFTNLLSKLDKTKKNILLLIISFIAIGIFKLSPIYLIIGGGIYSLCTK
ncbi:chromate transporter, partial [Clostridium tertium]